MRLTGRRLTIALAGVLAAVLIIGAGAAFAVGRAQRLAEGRPEPVGNPAGSSATTGNHDSSSQPPDSASTGGNPPPSQAGSSVPAPPHPSGVSPTTTPVDGPVPVTLSASAESAPHARQVRDLLSRHFTAINRHDYDAWLSTVSTAQAKQSAEKWRAAYRTTHDSNIYVSDINPGDPMTVRIQFVSHQSVELAPSALPARCVRWDVTYQILDEGTGLRVGNSAKAPSLAPCP